MRNPDDIPRFGRRADRGRSRSRSRTWIISIVVVVIVLVLSSQAIARFYTSYLWFDSVRATDVWSKLLVTKVALGAGFSLLFFALLYVNLTIADRLAPLTRVLTPEDELLERYRELVEPRQRLVRFVVSVLFGLVAGIGASGQWNNWLLFRNGGSFHVKDPQLHRDVGFYVFKLPFLSWLEGWAFASFVIITLVVAVVHYLNGGIRLQVGGQSVTPQVKAHLSVLLACIALLKAADYVLQRFELLQSHRGTVRGATYTDVNAQDPAIKLLILISLLSAVLFLLNIRKRGWALPIVAVSLWAVIALVAGAAYPWFIQSFQVSRKESAREAPYITRNIAATRTALGLDSVVENDFDYTQTPDDKEITANQATIDNIRLLDPTVSAKSFQNLESQLSYYTFDDDLDVDRYPIGPGGSDTEVVLGTRELNVESLPQKTWEASHLIYTHGYGVALAPANAVTDKGRPDFKVSGVDPISVAKSVRPTLQLKRPELYFSENIDGPTHDGYAIVDTTRKEKSAGLDTSYAGTGGVRMQGLLRRVAFYLRFGDLQTLTSDYLTPKSRILYVRDVGDRVRTIAPFLKFDDDPYPVIVDGRIKYVVDAYTTAANYPYGELADTRQVTAGADLTTESFNYLRNSVKAVVDAYDGDVTLYLTDTLYGGKDPIARAYAKTFPHLFTPVSKMPAALRAHLRYPEDMFRVQTTMWGRYHQDTSEDFYNNSDQWDVAQDPGNEIKSADTSSAPHDRIEPYYLQMRLPGQDSERFLLFRPFVPHSTDDSKKQLTSFMVANSDPKDYGRLQVFTMTQHRGGRTQRNRDVDGPLTIHSQIVSTTQGNVSQDLTLLNSDRGGSKVQLGNLLIIPIGDALLYVRPVYVSAAAADSVPELRRVILAMGDRTVVGETLQQAIGKLFPNADVTTLEGGTDTEGGGGTQGGGSTETPPAQTADPADLLARAVKAFADADAALKSGGASALQDYADKNAEGAALVKQAQEALDAGSSGRTGSASTTASSGSGSTSPATTTTTSIPATTTTGKA
jgi:uncharacterized membrane protein (UPF0182 family)